MGSGADLLTLRWRLNIVRVTLWQTVYCQSIRLGASAVILASKSRQTHGHILLSQIRDSPNLEGEGPVFISPSDRVALLYPQARGSLFVASYDSQGHGRGIWPRLNIVCWTSTSDRGENNKCNALKIFVLSKTFMYFKYGVSSSMRGGIGLSV
jgi:hypothetical protein